jgi:DNA-binding CsgD family transcriptional regulator/tetratricopeptide (TPR) repeat protein
MLAGRNAECAKLDQLLTAAREGQSGVLVLRGEAGIGKTALLEYLVERASGCRIARAVGIESEMELAFAGLHQLCAPMLNRLGHLPNPQGNALGAAFGLSTSDPPDRFLVALAVLSLLAEVAEEERLVCIVDDAQWLDHASAQALAFVARRLLAERIALVFAVREPGGQEDLAGLPELSIRGLNDRDARALLESAIRGSMDERVRHRMVAETGGNPLALLELPRGPLPAELAGGFGLPDTTPLVSRIEQDFVRRLEMLPSEAQRLVLTAAAEPVGDPLLVYPAAERLGIGTAAAAAAAETEGLLAIGEWVRFRHPLVRSAVYRSASAQERRAVHRALAEVTDPDVDPDRRAWHLAAAAPGPDEGVAQELEQSAGRAQARGGLAAAAAFLQRSVALTREPARRADRALAAARAGLQAGALDSARELLTAAEAGALGEHQRAQVDLLRAQIAFASEHGSAAPPLLLKAAKRFEALDLALARETYLDAFMAALLVGRLNAGVGVLEVAVAARVAPPATKPLQVSDLLLDGLATLITEGYAAGAPTLRQAVSSFRDQGVSAENELRWLPLACMMTHDLWDDEGWDRLSARLIELGRDVGALTMLPIGLSLRFAIELFAGEFATAESLAEETEAVSEVTRSDLAPYGALLLAAWRGREDETSQLIDAVTKEIVARGEGQWLTAIHWATAVLYNGLGRFEEARVAAEHAREYPHELGLSSWALVELVEAAARSGKSEQAFDTVQQLSEMARVTGTDWALGNEAYARALVSDGETAESLYREAIERLGRTRIRVQLARAQLLYGEWLRREGRRLEAREQLRGAHDMFTVIGMKAFAERAGGELLATGEQVRKRTVETRDELTPQEEQIARLARDGLSNPEIGARLFLSPRTVEWHLHKVFAKLGISSRKAIHDALPSREPAARALAR